MSTYTADSTFKFRFIAAAPITNHRIISSKNQNSAKNFASSPKFLQIFVHMVKGRLTAVRLVMLAATVALITMGIMSIYATEHPAELTQKSNPARLYQSWQRQILFVFVGLVAVIIINSIHYRRLGRVSYWLYAGILLLLVLLLLGKVLDIPFIPQRRGAHRWIQLPGLTFIRMQPSEFCKLAYILALAWYLRYRSNYRRLAALIGPFILTLLPMVLILAEPDLGTALLMMPVFFAMLFLAGAKGKHIIAMVLLALLIAPLIWRHLPDYQRMRISSVLLQNAWIREKARANQTFKNILVGTKYDIRNWERNEGYQLMHSKFAVASGGLGGHGYRHGPYVKYDFLPDRHNDFIFATIAHQWGFLGCLVLFALYATIVACGIEIASHNTDPFGRFVVVGIIAMFVVEVIVNISMTIGLMPITGLTLPLVSYGGSSLVVSMAAVGLLNNIGRCRPFTVART
jgi:rod shape determining protein RodA